MARIIYSNIVDEIVGSIGGMTFQRNGSGTIVRIKPLGKKLINNRQFWAVGSLTSYLREYRQKTSAVKLQWLALVSSFVYYDRFGVTRVISAANLFSICSSQSFLYFGNYTNVMPVLTVYSPYDPFILSLGVNSMLLSWAVPQTLVDGNIMVFATPPLSSLNVVPYSKFRYVYGSKIDSFSSFDVGFAWQNVFGMNVQTDLIDTGKHVFVYCYRWKFPFCVPSLIRIGSL